MLLCGTVAGADDFVELALWGGEHLAFLRRFLPYVHGVPSHDTLCEAVAGMDADGREVIAIDGKTLRRSHARSKGRGPLHTIAAWASG